MLQSAMLTYKIQNSKFTRYYVKVRGFVRETEHCTRSIAFYVAYLYCFCITTGIAAINDGNTLEVARIVSNLLAFTVLGFELLAGRNNWNREFMGTHHYILTFVLCECANILSVIILMVSISSISIGNTEDIERSNGLSRLNISSAIVYVIVHSVQDVLFVHRRRNIEMLIRSLRTTEEWNNKVFVACAFLSLVLFLTSLATFFTSKFSLEMGYACAVSFLLAIAGCPEMIIDPENGSLELQPVVNTWLRFAVVMPLVIRNTVTLYNYKWLDCDWEMVWERENSAYTITLILSPLIEIYVRTYLRFVCLWERMRPVRQFLFERLHRCKG